MRFIVSIVYFLFYLTFISTAQTYKYIGVEDGLSNRRIFSIKKDSTGYMWFLTNEGMDRYNGKEIKHYRLTGDEDTRLNSPIRLGWLYIGKNGELWAAGKSGRIFQYNSKYDHFINIYKLPKIPVSVSYSHKDRQDNIWLCTRYSITLYNTVNKQALLLPNILKSNITDIEQADDNHFFIATEKGIRYVKLGNRSLEIIPIKKLDNIQAQISELHFHQPTQRLFIGTFEKGIFAYDMRHDKIIHSNMDLSDVNIAKIIPLNATELLIATEGMGVHKMDIATCQSEPYITSTYENYNEMNGNNINDIYIDNEKRIWLANYPMGVTIIDNRYKNYNWIKHSIGNRQSLVNDQVHAVMEDSEGDLWFGTSNGISLYKSKTGQWHSFLSSFDQELKDKNHIFITLCEVSPGVIWAGGYTSGIYKINKKALSVEYFSPYLLTPANMRPDKYIRDIIKDSQGYVWSGGYYNLKCFDLASNEVQLYPGVSTVTAIAEKDSVHMWIGTSGGLYLLDRNSGKYYPIELQVESGYINTLYQDRNGLLYIGTNGSGLVVFDIRNHTFENYHAENSALVSNNIYTILPRRNGSIMMSTENGISCFSVESKTFRNWTKEQGLMSAFFNASAGTLQKDKGFVFGSTDGAVEFPENSKFPDYIYAPMIFTELHISYQPVYPGDKNSPLKKVINETDKLDLKYNQNSFSIKISSINYDSPDNVAYLWRLEGFYDRWNRLGEENLLRLTNLPSGKYTLHIRAISKAEPYRSLEERNIKVNIASPLWASTWAIICYILLATLLSGIGYRILALNKQKKISDEKPRVFMNTAHDILTPLTLIKAPLEELIENKKLDDKETNSMNIALRNVNALLQLTSNLINFERANVYSSKLCISERELNTYVREIYHTFQTYAETKHITFTYESNFSYLEAWFDKEKMDSILKNVISNALKYTPENGSVAILVHETKDNWKIEVRDTGIGVPVREQKKLFKLHFRGSNAINSKITGSGIGLMLVRKLVHLHNGKINIESAEHQGTTIRMSFPKGNGHFRKSALANPEKRPSDSTNVFSAPLKLSETPAASNGNLQKILIVEDNDELRAYLLQSLSSTFNVQVWSNGKEALGLVKEFWPGLILSDIMMPEMGGDELCSAIKNDMETSHIPVLLLTALADEKHILEGLQIGADEYIVKPFSLNILKASIANLLANRALLRSKYTSIELATDESAPAANNYNSLDWKFISEIKRHVEGNMSNQELTVDVLCSLMGMSRTSIYNKLKALTDQAPSDYIRFIRLEQAAQLLKEGQHSITEIAEMTGFCDSKYFWEVFKKHFKVNPSQYAKGEREEASDDQ